MTKSILVVDDQKEVLLVLCDMLREIDESYIIYEASSVEEGIAQYKKVPTDLVITDIMMPGASGYDLVREIRLLSPKTKILCMTGKGGFKNDAEAKQIAKGMKADDMLQKPFEFYSLAQKVQKLLGVKIKSVS